MKLLIINSHPDFQGIHTTNTLVKYIQENTSKLEVVTKNIYDVKENVHPITKDMLNMWKNSDTNSTIDLLREQQNSFIGEWIEAENVIILSPLHNFSLTSKLKDYFDNILVVNRTFKYTLEGSVGLLDNSKKVLYVQTSGSNYSKDFRYVNADIAPYYLRTLLSFMGITEMDLVRVEGLNLQGAKKDIIVENAKSEVDKFINNL